MLHQLKLWRRAFHNHHSHVHHRTHSFLINTILIAIFSSGCAHPTLIGNDHETAPSKTTHAGTDTPQALPLKPSEIQPSRQFVYFTTLDIPTMTMNTGVSVPREVLDQLQQSLIQATRETRLFTQVLPNAHYESGGGGVLSVRGTILNWTEDDTTAWVKIHVALIAKGIGDQFAESTAAGRITRHKEQATAAYDLTPLMEGISTLITTFMDPL